MSLFELLGEKKNPGSIGGFEKSSRVKIDLNLSTLLLKTIPLVGALTWIYITVSDRTFNLKLLAIMIMILFLYGLAGYWINPKPDYNNIGWLGGLIDHPFRFSDDINRHLIFMKIFLLPGRALASIFMSWVHFVLNKKRN